MTLSIDCHDLQKYSFPWYRTRILDILNQCFGTHFAINNFSSANVLPHISHMNAFFPSPFFLLFSIWSKFNKGFSTIYYTFFHWKVPCQIFSGFRDRSEIVAEIMTNFWFRFGFVAIGSNFTLSIVFVQHFYCNFLWH